MRQKRREEEATIFEGEEKFEEDAGLKNHIQHFKILRPKKALRAWILIANLTVDDVRIIYSCIVMVVFGEHRKDKGKKHGCHGCVWGA